MLSQINRKALLGLCAALVLTPALAEEMPTAGYLDSLKQIPAAIAAVPGHCAQAVYDKTLGEHPGKCLLATCAVFGAYVIRQQYNEWHTARAKTRRTILEKIEKTYNNYSQYGNTDWGNVHNQQQQSVLLSLTQLKNELINDASRVYNWGMLQDSKLTCLIDEFFAVLAKKASGNQLPAAAMPAAQPYWFQFWKKAQPSERILEDIFNDIKERLCGGC